MRKLAITALIFIITACSGGVNTGTTFGITSCGSSGSSSSPTDRGVSNETINGVWIGEFSREIITQVTSAPKGKVCLELNQEEFKINGFGWVSGFIWGESFNLTAENNNIYGTITGKDLKDRKINIDLFLNKEDTMTLTGTISIQDKNYNIILKKQENLQECPWADKNLVLAFKKVIQNLIQQKSTTTSSEHLDLILPSFITTVPKVYVKVDENIFKDWWIYIWEIRDNSSSAIYPTYTIGGLISNDIYSSWAGWYTKGIGLDAENKGKEINVLLENIQNNDIDIAIYKDNTITFSSDGVEDFYYNKGTKISENPSLITECINGKQYKVWISQIPFLLKFSGTDLNNNNHSFEIPIGNFSDTITIPSVYIEIYDCETI